MNVLSTYRKADIVLEVIHVTLVLIVYPRVRHYYSLPFTRKETDAESLSLLVPDILSGRI